MLDASIGKNVDRIRQDPGVFAQLWHYTLNLLRHNYHITYDNVVSLERVLDYKAPRKALVFATMHSIGISYL